MKNTLILYNKNSKTQLLYVTTVCNQKDACYVYYYLLIRDSYVFFYFRDTVR